MSLATLIWAIIFGSIGLGFFVYGRKQQTMIPLFCGLGLMIFPYFIHNTIALVISGAILIAIPWITRD